MPIIGLTTFADLKYSDCHIPTVSLSRELYTGMTKNLQMSTFMQVSFRLSAPDWSIVPCVVTKRWTVPN
jgi:hypothetical protein